MQVGDKVTIIDNGESGVIRNMTNSLEGTQFFNRPIAIIRVNDGDGYVLRARTEDELR